MRAILRTALALCAALHPLTVMAQSLRITNLTVTPTDVQIDWNAASNLYIVSQRPSLTTGTTAYVGAVVTTNTSTVSNDTATRFYRIREVEVVTFPDPNFESAVRLTIPHKYAPSNQVYDIDVDTITTLSTADAGITSIVGVAWMAGLTNLDCRNNSIPYIDLSGCTNLVELDCGFNELTELDLSQNRQLSELYCDWNQTMTNLLLPIGGSMVTLYCNNNLLTVLDISGNTNLAEVFAHNNANLAEIIVWDTNNPPAVFHYSPANPWIHEP